MLITVHLILAIILFFGVNLLGQYSPSSLKYYQLNLLSESDDAPAFNFLIRVLTPSVYLIIISSLFYYIKYDWLVNDIFKVSLYYIIIRLLFNIAINRYYLISWPREFLYSISIYSSSHLVYDKLLIYKKNLLPDFTNIANELWVIIAIFIYNILNNVKVNSSRSEKRKLVYISSQFKALRAKFGDIIDREFADGRLKDIFYAIMIYESFNRPKAFRIIENLNFLLTKKPHTLGIMQINTSNYIDDKQSIILALHKIKSDVQEVQNEFNDDLENYHSNERKEEIYQSKLIEKYNIGYSYIHSILDIAKKIQKEFYPNNSTDLFSNIST